ncbi:hypothetical protein B0070_1354 [Bifidobacterium adolescentis]|nr:hypothetical protein B0070_1354 [Bifidobacterium adolescentis]
MRIVQSAYDARRPSSFLSIQAQDFIEERCILTRCQATKQFLSIQAQDFIEDKVFYYVDGETDPFLSIQAQDFIEDVVQINGSSS